VLQVTRSARKPPPPPPAPRVGGTEPQIDPGSGLPVPDPLNTPGGRAYPVVCPWCLNGRTARLKLTVRNHYSIYCLGCGTRVFANTSAAEAAIRAWQRLLSDDDTARALAARLADIVSESETPSGS